jgi:hypothetical protein
MGERVLLHVCCGPCGIFPVESLRGEGFEVFGFFYNSNIQPFQEYLKRKEAVKAMSGALNLRMIWNHDYRVKEWLRQAAFREEFRCELCYHSRLSEAAIYARKGKFDYFSSSIFYSRQQKHDLAREVAESVAKEQKVKFLYRDFRTGWKQGIERSVETGLYRQQYCGCIYSEFERYSKADKVGEEVAG